MAYLIQKHLNGSVLQQWELTDQPARIGRGSEADIQIGDERMSRLHCRIVTKAGAFHIEDLGSTNGTWVNNSRVTAQELKANDKLRLGQTVLIFQLEPPKGLATVMGEIEAEGKGLHTYIGELSAPPSPQTKS